MNDETFIRFLMMLYGINKFYKMKGKMMELSVANV